MSIALRLLLVVLASLAILGARVVDRRLTNAYKPAWQVVSLAKGSDATRLGQAPPVGPSDFIRIQTRLAYVEQLLREHTPAGLPAPIRQRRHHLLDLLHCYWQAGIFPHSEALDGQRYPYFIDQEGRLCAVGYLLEQTLGRSATQRLSQRFRYSSLLAMQDAELSRWAASSGLSPHECALIQPIYSSVHLRRAPHQKTGLSHGASSAVLNSPMLSDFSLDGFEVGKLFPRAWSCVPTLIGAEQAANVSL